MVSASTALITAAVVSTAATAYSLYEQDKAGDKAEAAQEQANRASQASAQVENARRRRKAIAQARMAAAANASNMSQSVQTSSALSGVQSSLGTQLGSNIGAQQQQIGSQQQIMNLQQQSANALRTGRERASMAQGIGNIASTGLNLYGSNFAMAPPSGVNTQGQRMPLYDNNAYISRY